LQVFRQRLHYDPAAKPPFMTDEPGDTMSVETETETSLARAIQDHLDLKQRNSDLGNAMQIERYNLEDPFENHPLFKSEEQARIEETLESVLDEPVATLEEEPILPWPGEDSTEGPALADSLWGKSRDFDWGD
jgi:hypothetical protein